MPVVIHERVASHYYSYASVSEAAVSRAPTTALAFGAMNTYGYRMVSSGAAAHRDVSLLPPRIRQKDPDRKIALEVLLQQHRTRTIFVGSSTLHISK